MILRIFIDKTIHVLNHAFGGQIVSCFGNYSMIIEREKY